MPKPLPVIAFGSDHAGFALKAALISRLTETKRYVIEDMGTKNTESADYPDYAQKVAKAVQKGKVDFGILICGTGIGISIAANRFKHVRAALCFTPEMAELARMHNDANILALGGRFISPDDAFEVAETFLKTKFTREERHSRRIDKIDAIEK